MYACVARVTMVAMRRACMNASPFTFSDSTRSGRILLGTRCSRQRFIPSSVKPVIDQLAEHLTVDVCRYQMVPGSIPGDRIVTCVMLRMLATAARNVDCNSVASSLWANQMCTPGPHRLVVRTSRCGRDNPGSTPGEDMFTLLA